MFFVHLLLSAAFSLFFALPCVLSVGIALYIVEVHGNNLFNRICLAISLLLLLLPVCLFVLFIYGYFAFDFNFFNELKNFLLN